MGGIDAVLSLRCRGKPGKRASSKKKQYQCRETLAKTETFLDSRRRGNDEYSASDFQIIDQSRRAQLRRGQYHQRFTLYHVAGGWRLQVAAFADRDVIRLPAAAGQFGHGFLF